MDTYPPPNFLIEFGRITRTIFFNIGGGATAPPPLPPLAGATARKSNNKPPLYVSQLNLYLDKEGILRCRTRIGKATISVLSKTPILLPSKNWYSELLVYDCHEKVFHDGIGETLHILRQKYWVLRGREKVKRVIRRCTVCKKLEGLPYKTVFCPELPKCRVDEGPPFSNVGIDFAGPLIVSDMPNNKCYICLFT